MAELFAVETHCFVVVGREASDARVAFERVEGVHYLAIIDTCLRNTVVVARNFISQTTLARASLCHRVIETFFAVISKHLRAGFALLSIKMNKVARFTLRTFVVPDSNRRNLL